MKIPAFDRVDATGEWSSSRPSVEQRCDDARSDAGFPQRGVGGERARRHALEEQVAALFQRRTAIQENERRRIARDIHDHVGQQVTALRIHLQILNAHCQAQPTLLEEVAKLQALTEVLDRSLDGLIWQQRRDPLCRGTLDVALAAFVSAWSEQFGIAAECSVSTEAARHLPEDAAQNLSAIVQEALHNVVKHARATSVAVSVSRRGDRAVLLIEDDGKGFTPSAGSATGGRFGLLTMRERAELAGGEIEIESSPGHGTSIYVRIPLSGAKMEYKA
jgi:signal transduction histidine kinase